MNDMELCDCEETLNHEMKNHEMTKLVLRKERTYLWASGFLMFVYILLDSYRQIGAENDNFWTGMVAFSLGSMVYCAYKCYTAYGKVKELL